MGDQLASQSSPTGKPLPSVELVDLKGTTVPFNWPRLQGNELDYIRRSVEHGVTSADGPFSKAVVELLIDEVGCELALLTTSCTAALELSAMLLDLGPDDTVVVPSFAFVTSALAFTRQGAKVLFCDIEPETLALDPAHLSDLMDPSVRAVVPIHYAGVGCDLDGIEQVLADWPEASLIEDNAHGLFGSHRDRPLGSVGRMATLSFHETKNFTCGEGGALILNDQRDVDRAQVLYHKGTNRNAFLHGLVDKYTWQDTGSSFGLSDVLAAYLYAQLEQRESIMARRRHVWDRYRDLLTGQVEDLGVTLPVVPEGRVQAHHMFYVLLDRPDRRNEVLAAMRASGVMGTFHYLPLHLSPHGQTVSRRPTECPVSEDVSGRLLRLPFFTDLSDSEGDRVVAALLEALTATA